MTSVSNNATAPGSQGVLSLVDGQMTHAAPPSIVSEPPTRKNTTLRSVLFWSHLVTAVVVGTVVAIMCVTGAAVAYEKQLLDHAVTKHHVLPPTAGAARLPLDSLYARATSAPSAARVTSLTLFADSTIPVSLGLETRQSVFVDPYTARVVGDDASVRSFTNYMLKWHRSLNIGGQVRSPVGTAITGVANLAFLFLIVSGYVLWFPRQWSSRAFRAVIRFNPRARGKARDWNWHHVLGFWSAPALFLIVLAGTFMSYRWPGELLERYAGGGARRDASAVSREGGQPRERGPAREGDGAPRAREGGTGARADGGRAEGGRRQPSLDSVALRASTMAKGWRTIQIRLPREAGGALTVTAAMTLRALPNERVQLSVDRRIGVLTPSAPQNGTGAAAKIRSWVRPVHTGEAAGIVGQTVAAIVSLAAAALFWTGMALAWRRLRNRLARRARVVQRAEVTA